MNTTDMQMAMFLQQRLQILDLGSKGKIDPSYVYAWEKSIYPFLDDTDGSVVQHPHELFKECFLVSDVYIKEIWDTLIKIQEKGDVFTFWDLEDYLQNQGYDQYSDRSKLIAICTYFRLKRNFTDTFWKNLIMPQRSPSESGSILDTYDPVNRSDYNYLI